MNVDLSAELNWNMSMSASTTMNINMKWNRNNNNIDNYKEINLASNINILL